MIGPRQYKHRVETHLPRQLKDRLVRVLAKNGFRPADFFRDALLRAIQEEELRQENPPASA